MFVRKKKFFGTDGIRGPINEITNPEFVLKLGWAAGKVFSEMSPTSYQTAPPRNKSQEYRIYNKFGQVNWCRREDLNLHEQKLTTPSR